MWTLENVKTCLDDLRCPKMTPTTWIVNVSVQERWQQRLLPCPKSHNGRSRFQQVHAIEESAEHCSRQTLLKRKSCPQSWYQQYPQTQMNKSKWLKRWLTYWTEQIKRLVWLCRGTIWRSQKVHMLNSNYLQRTRRTRSFNKLFVWIINLKNLSIYSM